MEKKELILRFAQLHANDWKTASWSNAEITKKIAAAMAREGYAQKESLDIADATLKYMERYF